MGWYRELKTILAGEPETWLAYLYGQRLENMPRLTTQKPRYRGLFLQLAKFGAALLRDLRLKEPGELQRRAKFLVFSGTANQISALDGTIDALKQRGQKVTAIASMKHLGNSDHSTLYTPFSLKPVDALRSIILLLTRGIKLYRALKAAHPVSVNWYFSEFCRVYTYLAFFYRILSQIKPDFVITSNDHNAPNRCMLAVAHSIGVKTVYLQHASVSPIFPALRVNYAFLDGQSALDTYRLCEPNQPGEYRKTPVPEIILSGQKKYINKSNSASTNGIGIALNALDNPSQAIALAKNLAAKGLRIWLRWHPAQVPGDISQYRAELSNYERVSLSNPLEQSISHFFSHIGWLIAGNSSIHLEAALAGVRPIYYEFTPADHPDYYGYVKHGLATPAGTVEEIRKLVEPTRYDQDAPNADAVRYYSATYGSEWQGKEGELVAECLMLLVRSKVEGARLADLFAHEFSGSQTQVRVVGLETDEPSG